MPTRPTDIYSLEGLAWLREELARREAQWDKYSGNNPNKWAAARKSLRQEIDVVSETLKARGSIRRPAAELLKRALDAQTPGRLKGCCTELAGQWYRINFVGKDDDGFWQWKWDPIQAEEVNVPGTYVHPGPKRQSPERKS